MNLNAGEGFAVPFALLNGLVSLGNVTSHGHEHSYGMLGGGHGVAFGSVQNHDAFSGGCGDIDIIHANAGAADNFKACACFDNFFGNAGEGASYESVIIIDNLNELGRLHVGHNVHIKMLAQQRHALFANIITYKYFHLYVLLS